jgi:hypothetical protein
MSMAHPYVHKNIAVSLPPAAMTPKLAKLHPMMKPLPPFFSRILLQLSDA